jgi:hypothetical protein
MEALDKALHALPRVEPATAVLAAVLARVHARGAPQGAGDGPPHGHEEATIPARLASVIATLLPPPAPRPGLAGARAGGAGAPTRMTYGAGGVRIVLTVGSDPDVTTSTLQGLVLSPDHTSEALCQSRVELLREDTVVATTNLNEFGHFTLSSVPAGELTLQVLFPDQIVVIPHISLLK